MSFTAFRDQFHLACPGKCLQGNTNHSGPCFTWDWEHQLTAWQGMAVSASDIALITGYPGGNYGWSTAYSQFQLYDSYDRYMSIPNAIQLASRVTGLDEGQED